MLLISTDSGKKFGKGTADGKNITKITSKLDILKEADNNYRNLIEFDGQYCVLGDEAKTVSYDSSKEQLLHKLTMYYNVCRYITDYGQEVNLTINMPITHFEDVKQREKFKNYMLDERDIEMSIGNKKYMFKINDILVIAEGTGIIFEQPELFKDKSAIICNIGGLNSTCLQVNNKKIVRHSPFISNFGGNILETDIKTEVNRNGKYNFQPHEIPFLFDSKDKYIQDAINYCSENILDSVIEDMKAHNYNVTGCNNIYFEGGTSLRLKNKIEKKGFKVVEDPINQDIRGNHLFGMKTFGKH